MASACVQLTDEWVRTTLEGQGSVANLRNNLLQGVHSETQDATKQKVRMEIMEQLSDIVDAEVPDYLVTQVAQNEFQAQLFEIGQQVWSSCGLVGQGSEMRSACAHHCRHLAVRAGMDEQAFDLPQCACSQTCRQLHRLQCCNIQVHVLPGGHWAPSWYLQLLHWHCPCPAHRCRLMIS